MSSENQILVTTINDIARIEKVLEGNSVRNMRRALEAVERRLVIFERRLIELRSNESIIKSRIYNNADALFISNNYLSGKTQLTEPQQSYSLGYEAADPHQNYSYSKFNIHATALGVQQMDSELNRIDREIKAIQAHLREYEVLKDKITKALEDAETQKKKSLKNTLGQLLPPTPTDLQQDKIARARTANLLLLYKIALNYRELSYLPDTEQRVYPDENKLPKQLKILRQIFWAHAQAPGLQFDRKDELTYDDPANSKNLQILQDAVGETWYTARNTKTSLEIDRYVRDVQTIANDPLVSTGIERRADISIPESRSLSVKTKSYPASVLRIGDSYYGSFEIPTFLECVKKWWKKRNANCYFGLPQCPNVVEPYPTTGDEKKAEYNETRSDVIIAAEREYILSLAEAKGYVQAERDVYLGLLPDDAPDWVKVFVGTFGDSKRGSLDWGGKTVVVLYGISTESGEKAIENANKIVTFSVSSGMEQRDYYYYAYLLGYSVTYTNGRVKFYSSVEWETPANEKIKLGVKSIEESVEYRGYVLWA